MNWTHNEYIDIPEMRKNKHKYFFGTSLYQVSEVTIKDFNITNFVRNATLKEEKSTNRIQVEPWS